MAKYYEHLGKTEFPNLVNEVGTQPVIKGTRTVLSGQGVLKAGTALAANAAGKLVILGTADAKANSVLAEDIDTTGGDVTALVYLSGHFNRNHLAVKASYEITAADVEDFRMAGIILGISME